MQYQDLEIKLPVSFSQNELKRIIGKMLHVKHFTYEILLQSLDARRKPDVHWQLRIRVISDELKGNRYDARPRLIIPYRMQQQHVVVTGSGPAGFFAGFVLQKAGYRVTIIEKGPMTNKRYEDILNFEAGSAFKANSNYCHGEGGAGTFSDGKLTSRTKGIALEKQFVFESYVNAGAPEEILYLAKPHIGSDNLRVVIPTLRRQFENLGGKILFETEVTSLRIRGKKCTAVITANSEIPCDLLILAPGHSSYNTYRMMRDHGILFRNKPFAIGVRVEHPQELINLSQWQTNQLPGVKAAEYKLTFTSSEKLPVYSFCMCPGGKVIPSAPDDYQNIVNGVSDYARNSPFANSAIVVGIDPGKIIKKEPDFLETLNWLELLERKIFDLTGSYQIPGQRISDYIHQKTSSSIPLNSFPFGVFPYNFEELLPAEITKSLREGMIDFCEKIKGFETGLMMGLESKTSAPVQVLRDEHRRCEGFDNIFVIGEGSGYAGGITSSAVDGVKLAIELVNR